MEYSVELCFPCKIKRQNKPQKWYFYFIDIRLNAHPQLWCFLNYTVKVSAQIVLILSDSLMKCRKLYCYTIGSSIFFPRIVSLFCTTNFAWYAQGKLMSPFLSYEKTQRCASAQLVRGSCPNHVLI